LLPVRASFCCGDGRSGSSSGEGGVGRRTIQNFGATSDEPALPGGNNQKLAATTGKLPAIGADTKMRAATPANNQQSKPNNQQKNRTIA